MDNKEIYQKEQDIKRQQRYEREQDRMIGENLNNQNDRLERLIKNYRLNKEWKRIVWRMSVIEKIKRLFRKKRNGSAVPLDKHTPKELT